MICEFIEMMLLVWKIYAKVRRHLSDFHTNLPIDHCMADEPFKGEKKEICG